MKTLYLDCGMGAAGDMLTAALYELLNDEERKSFIEQINGLNLPGVNVSASKMMKCGIVGTHMTVTVGGIEEDVIHEHSHEHHHDHEHHHNHEHEHDHEHEHEHHHDQEHDQEHDHDHEHEHDHDHNHSHDHAHGHHHSSLHDIENIINNMNVSATVKANVISIYKLIAEAESVAHDKDIYEIHFHEVGTMDAIVDVTSVCILMEKLDILKVYASPVHVGSGHVHCAHGILPVPAPATAYILKGVPIYGGGIKGELCTPTGAAILKHFVNEFGNMPIMTTEQIGYGMGKKDFTAANCVRAMLGETL